jgi:SAM-dependent methyltransferase
MRGWVEPYRVSIGLGVRELARRRHLRDAVIRVVVPMDPSRYLELPWAVRRLDVRPGETVLDLASPKLLCVVLARHGARVTSVDQLPEEIEKWRSIARDEANLELRVADGRTLPFEDASFDHATSISVLEHVGGEGGDAAALAELARCVRPDGRLAITLPHAPAFRIEFRRGSAYVDEGKRDFHGAAFFQRWYDDAEVDRLVAAVPAVELVERDVVRLSPNLNTAYNWAFPLLVPLGPFFGLLARERSGPDGDVVRLLLRRR